MRLPASLSRMRRRLNPWGTTGKGRKATFDHLDHPTAPPICVKENTHLIENDNISMLEDFIPPSEMYVEPEPTMAADVDVDGELDKASVRAARRRRRAEREEEWGLEDSRVPRLSGRSRIVRHGSELSSVLSAVPIRQRGRDLQRIYSSADDGVSLGTLYTSLGRNGGDGVILLVRDTGGAVFGAYTSVPFQPSKCGGGYQGSGECFVFSIRPELGLYKWTRNNNYFQLCRPESLALGGGGEFALHLDSMLELGTSGACDTFDNVCLASNSRFEVVVVEVYALVVPSRLVLDNDDTDNKESESDCESE